MPRVETGQNPTTGLGGLDGIKADKLAEINAAFAQAEKEGHVLSSLGFEVDATDRANRDIEGLLKKLTATGETQAYFCDYHNAMQSVTIEGLKTIQLEIIDFGQQLYAKKWLLREAVQNANSVEEINTIKW